MEISWLSHSCFRLSGKNVTLITDPFTPQQDHSLGKTNASIVTVSHDHPGHNYVQGVSGNPRIVRGPGEYEISDVLITGVATYHDAKKGQEYGRNTIYIIHLDDIAICHLGDLGHPLQESQLEQAADADVLLVPIAGKHSINATQAAEVISQIEPRIVIPMHYQPTPAEESLDAASPLMRFCKEMGVEVPQVQQKLVVTRNNLPITRQVVLLAARS